jgi:hypothetical protein
LRFHSDFTALLPENGHSTENLQQFRPELGISLNKYSVFSPILDILLRICSVFSPKLAFCSGFTACSGKTWTFYCEFTRVQAKHGHFTVNLQQFGPK